MTGKPVVVCCSTNTDPNWRWITPAIEDSRAEFRHFDCQPKNWIERHVHRPYVARYRASLSAGRFARRERAAAIVSHGPRVTVLAALMAGNAPGNHLAFSFNFTHLPHGRMRAVMARAFRSVDRFAVASEVERELYARHFDLPKERFDLLLWGVGTREPPPGMPAPIEGDYVCAVGGEGRDYATLMEAMARLPHIPLVAVVRPESLEGVTVPDNVHVKVNIPPEEAQNVVKRSRLMALPLRDAEVPCGHVTLVSAMQLRTPIVATDSRGIRDYVRHDDNGILCPPRDPVALAQAIEGAWEEPAHTKTLVDRAERFVFEQCSEASTIRYFDTYLERLGV